MAEYVNYIYSEYVMQRTIEEAEYIVETESTLRETAKVFYVSKSTVHADMIKRLPKINLELYKHVGLVLSINKAERHIRGGYATKNKYLSMDMLENKRVVG